MNIVVLTGGTSPEREISFRSGKAIVNGLRAKGHSVIPIDPAFGDKQPKTEDELFTFNPNESRISNENYIKCIQSDLMKNCELVFIALHGKWGEDGTVQSLLELKGLKYTGSGVLSSAVAIDKCMTKILFQHYGVITPKWIMVDNLDYKLNIVLNQIEKSFGFPCITKPNDQGSTVGFTLVKDKSQLKDAIDFAFKFSDRVMIEEYICGREITVSVLDHDALPIVEVRPKHEMYDYECKYTKGMTEYICPASLDERVVKLVNHQALVAYNSCQCRDFARVDFMLNEKNEPYCLEINTIPGMTDLSLFPKSALAVGIDFPNLMQRIVDLAIKH